MGTRRTTETLREMLFEAMEAVRSGRLDHQAAKTLATLADKIIDSAELELRYSETCSHLDQQGTGISPGPLMLTDRSQTKAEAP